MEIKTTNTASLNSKTVHKLQDLHIKYDAASFKAIIVNKISDQFFSINTKVGTLKILTDLPLQVGDELTLSLKLNNTAQLENLNILKITRVLSNNAQSVTQSFANKELVPTLLLNNQAALKNFPQNQDHFIAKIISHDNKSFNLKSLNGDIFSISKDLFKSSDFNIHKDEFLAIKRISEKNIELQLISKEQLLHQTQRQLLPKQQTSQQTHQRLSQAAFRLFEAINNDVQQMKEVNSSVKTESQKIKSTQSHLSSLSSNSLLALKDIKYELNSLLTSHKINFKFLGADTIQKLLSSLNALNQAQNLASNNHSFSQKLSLVNQSINHLLAELESHVHKNKSISAEEEFFLNSLKTSLKEALQSFETSLHKILFQHTSSKLNLEVNNTLLINTQIPFEIEKQTRDVNLKIKQHKKESEDQEDAWEIHLSLEMGLLGLISTKIMLKDQYDVSIQFWAELINTKQLIEDKKHIFQQQMSNAGFTLKDFTILLGKKIEEVMPINITNKQFIDINV